MKIIFTVFVMFFAIAQGVNAQEKNTAELDAYASTVSVARSSETHKVSNVIIPDDLLNVRVYPIPWIIGSAGRQGSASKSCGNGLIIDGIVSDVHVCIYNIQADLVWEKNAMAMDKCVAWNGKNTFGNNVASGVYIILVTSKTGGSIKKTVAIQR